MVSTVEEKRADNSSRFTSLPFRRWPSLWMQAAVLATAMSACVSGEDWRAWRGPNGNGIANSTAPVSWSETKNIRWRAEVPGRGHSSPIVVGNQVILSTADENKQVQSVVAYDRASGTRLWKQDISRGGFPSKIHAKNTHASPTIASNGKALFVVFHHHSSVHLTALDLTGEHLWKKDVGEFLPKAYSFGYAPSPCLHKSLVIVAAEVESNGFLAAFDQSNGAEVWRIPREGCITHSSPIVAPVAGRNQLLLSGCQSVSSFDPDSGRILWTTPGAAKETCGTIVWDQDIVFASGGYPKKETLAVQGDGSGEVLWRNNTACFEQSLLAYDGYVYAVDDNSVANCWEVRTGERMWRGRLGGKFSSSPVFANGNIYVTNEDGTMFTTLPQYRSSFYETIGMHRTAILLK